MADNFVPVSVYITDLTGDEAVTKGFRVTRDRAVAQLLNDVMRKLGVSGLMSDYALFRPRSNGRGGSYLLSHKMVSEAGLTDEMQLTLVAKQRILRVTTVDNMVKTLQVDDSQPAAEILKAITKKFKITDHLEYGICVDSDVARTEDHHFLNLMYSLPEQGVNRDDVILFRKRFYASDHAVNEQDPAQLHIIYVECRDAIVGNIYPVTKDKAIEMAALQCQVTYGNFNGSVMRPGVLTLSDYVPSLYTSQLDVEARILDRYEALAEQNMSELYSKYRYVELCRALKTYGITKFEVFEPRSGGRERMVHLGISKNRILRVNPATNDIISRFKITQLARWSCTKNHLTLDFGRYAKSVYRVRTAQGDKISQLISGYIEIILARRSNEIPVEQGAPEDPLEEHVGVEEMGMRAEGAAVLGERRKKKKKDRRDGSGESDSGEAEQEDLMVMAEASGVERATRAPDGDFLLMELLRESNPELGDDDLAGLAGDLLDSLFATVAGQAATVLTKGVVPNEDAFDGPAVRDAAAVIDAALVHLRNGVQTLDDGSPRQELLDDMEVIQTEMSKCTQAARTLTGNVRADNAATKEIIGAVQTTGDAAARMTAAIDGVGGAGVDPAGLDRALNNVVGAYSQLILHTKDLAGGVQDDPAKYGSIVGGIKDLAKVSAQLRPLVAVLAPMLPDGEAGIRISDCCHDLQLRASSLVAGSVRVLGLAKDDEASLDLSRELKLLMKAVTALIAVAKPNSTEAAIIAISRAIDRLDTGLPAGTVGNMAEFAAAKQAMIDATASLGDGVNDVMTGVTVAEPQQTGVGAAEVGRAVGVMADSALVMGLALGDGGHAEVGARLADRTKAVGVAAGRLVGAAKQASMHPDSAEAVTAVLDTANVSNNALFDLMAVLEILPTPGEREFRDARARVSEADGILATAADDARARILETSNSPYADVAASLGEPIAALRAAVADVVGLAANQSAQTGARSLALADATATLVAGLVEATKAVRCPSTDDQEQVQEGLLGASRAVVANVARLLGAAEPASEGMGDSAAELTHRSASLETDLAALEATLAATAERVSSDSTVHQDALQNLLARIGAAPADGAPAVGDLEQLKAESMPPAVRGLAQSVLKIAQAAKAGRAEVETALGAAEGALGAFVDVTNAIVACSSPASATAVTTAARELGAAVICVATMAESGVTKGLSSHAKEVTSFVSAYITAVRAAEPPPEVDPRTGDAVAAISAGLANVNDLILSATTGDLESDGLSADARLAAVDQGRLDVALGTTALEACVMGSADDNDLGGAAASLSAGLGATLNVLGGLACDTMDPLAQHDLLAAAKVLAATLGDMLGKGQHLLEASGLESMRGGNVIEAARAINEGSRIAIVTSAELLARAARPTVREAAPAGTDAVEMDGLADATRAFATTSARLVRAVDKSVDELATASASNVDALKAMVLAVRGFRGAMHDEAHVEAVLASAEAAVDGTVALYAKVRQGLSDGTERDALAMDLAETASSIASAMMDVIRRAEADKTAADNLVDMSDPNVAAEHELLRAAAAIEAAAAKLTELRPRVEVTADADLSFNEQIIVAATALANCTKLLVEAAQVAQQERVAAGAVHDGERYFENARWNEGLVSAAKTIVVATNELADAGNELVSAGTGELRLIAAAKEVSSSTAHLVMACTVKSDVTSPTQENLKTASRAVKSATAKLVEAATTAADLKEEDPLTKLRSTSVGQMMQLMNRKTKILEMERRLEQERRAMLALQKQQYTNAREEKKRRATLTSSTAAGDDNGGEGTS